MTDAVTDEIKVYLATWLETQDTSTLGLKAVRSHINEHFNANVDKDAFKTALIEATSQVKNKQQQQQSSSSTTVTAAATEEGESTTKVSRGKRKAPLKSKEEKEKDNNDNNDNNNGDDGENNQDGGNAQGQADDVLNEVFGDDDGDADGADGADAGGAIGADAD
jgi:hypothetical protein